MVQFKTLYVPPVTLFLAKQQELKICKKYTGVRNDVNALETKFKIPYFKVENLKNFVSCVTGGTQKFKNLKVK